jgi:hypothetical protein
MFVPVDSSDADTVNAPGVNTVTADYYVRQNPWRTNTYALDFVRLTGAIHVPYTHSQLALDAHHDGFTPEDARLTIGIPVGAIVVVAGNKEGLLVRVTSSVKEGALGPLYAAWDNSTHVPVRIFDKNDAEAVKVALDAGYALQPFVALYREVEILGPIGEVADWRKVAQMASSGRKVNHFKNVNITDRIQ